MDAFKEMRISIMEDARAEALAGNRKAARVLLKEITRLLKAGKPLPIDVALWLSICLDAVLALPKAIAPFPISNVNVKTKTKPSKLGYRQANRSLLKGASSLLKAGSPLPIETAVWLAKCLDSILALKNSVPAFPVANVSAKEWRAPIDETKLLIGYSRHSSTRGRHRSPGSRASDNKAGASVVVGEEFRVSFTHTETCEKLYIQEEEINDQIRAEAEDHNDN